MLEDLHQVVEGAVEENPETGVYRCRKQLSAEVGRFLATVRAA
ncbi:hypothetical protein [Methylobacterium tarhaniae]